MRGAVSMGFLACFSALAGCNDAQSQDNLRKMENPPPKPPNCPNLPELKNIILMDGSIPDVRIIQFRETKLYVPAVLIKHAFYNRNAVSHETFKDNRFYVPQGLRWFVPDIHERECPGVIHKIRTDKYSRYTGFYMIIGTKRNYGLNIDPSSPIQKIGFHFWKDGYGSESYGSPGGGYESANAKMFNDVYANYNISLEGEPRPEINSSDWIRYRESVRGFAHWLAIPPRDRDNARVFKLGAK